MTDLLMQFANPQTLKTMSLANKLLAGLFTTVLGMGITFLSLIILQLIISCMNRLINTREKLAFLKRLVSGKSNNTTDAVAIDDKKIVCAIYVSLAEMLGTSTDRILIKSIVKAEAHSPSWNQTGLVKKMNNRLESTGGIA